MNAIFCLNPSVIASRKDGIFIMYRCIYWIKCIYRYNVSFFEFGSLNILFFPFLSTLTKIKGFPLCSTKQETVRKVDEMLVIIKERVTCYKNAFLGSTLCQHSSTNAKTIWRQAAIKANWNKCGRSTLCLNVFKQSFRYTVFLINLPGHSAKASSKHGNFTCVVNRDHFLVGTIFKDCKGIFVAGLIGKEWQINALFDTKELA